MHELNDKCRIQPTLVKWEVRSLMMMMFSWGELGPSGMPFPVLTRITVEVVVTELSNFIWELAEWLFIHAHKIYRFFSR